jgi:hypothetical protein
MSPVANDVAHFEPAGVDGRSFFFGASSGVGGLQTEPGLFLAVKRGDVESLQSPIAMLVPGRRSCGACSSYDGCIPHFSFSRYSMATTFGGHRL